MATKEAPTDAWPCVVCTEKLLLTDGFAWLVRFSLWAGDGDDEKGKAEGGQRRSYFGASLGRGHSSEQCSRICGQECTLPLCKAFFLSSPELS